MLWEIGMFHGGLGRDMPLSAGGHAFFRASRRS